MTEEILPLVNVSTSACRCTFPSKAGVPYQHPSLSICMLATFFLSKQNRLQINLFVKTLHPYLLCQTDSPCQCRKEHLTTFLFIEKIYIAFLLTILSIYLFNSSSYSRVLKNPVPIFLFVTATFKDGILLRKEAMGRFFNQREGNNFLV